MAVAAWIITWTRAYSADSLAISTSRRMPSNSRRFTEETRSDSITRSTVLPCSEPVAPRARLTSLSAASISASASSASPATKAPA